MSNEPTRYRQSRRRPVTQTAMVRELSRHEPEAWNAFYSTYWRWLLGVCLNMGIPYADSQDLVQTTFIRVNANIGDFQFDRSRGRFSGWLLVIVGNLARDYWRRNACESKRRPMHRPSRSDLQTQPLYRIAGPQKDRGGCQPHTFGEWITRRHWPSPLDGHDEGAVISHIAEILASAAGGKALP